MLSQTVSVSRVMFTIGDFTPSRLGMLGMAGADVSAIPTDPRAEYRQFHAWLARRLEPLDPGADLPARRVTNKVHRDQIAARTLDERQASVQATERLRIVINRIVVGSIVDSAPEGSRGDLVADESIFDLAGPGAGLGTRPEKHRGAAYFGRYYVRDRRAVPLPSRDKLLRSAKPGSGLASLQ